MSDCDGKPESSDFGFTLLEKKNQLLDLRKKQKEISDKITAILTSPTFKSRQIRGKVVKIRDGPGLDIEQINDVIIKDPNIIGPDDLNSRAPDRAEKPKRVRISFSPTTTPSNEVTSSSDNQQNKLLKLSGTIPSGTWSSSASSSSSSSSKLSAKDRLGPISVLKRKSVTSVTSLCSGQGGKRALLQNISVQTNRPVTGQRERETGEVIRGHSGQVSAGQVDIPETTETGIQTQISEISQDIGIQTDLVNISELGGHESRKIKLPTRSDFQGKKTCRVRPGTGHILTQRETTTTTTTTTTTRTTTTILRGRGRSESLRRRIQSWISNTESAQASNSGNQRRPNEEDSIDNRDLSDTVEQVQEQLEGIPTPPSVSREASPVRFPVDSPASPTPSVLNEVAPSVISVATPSVILVNREETPAPSVILERILPVSESTRLPPRSTGEFRAPVARIQPPSGVNTATQDPQSDHNPEASDYNDHLTEVMSSVSSGNLSDLSDTSETLYDDLFRFRGINRELNLDDE